MSQEKIVCPFSVVSGNFKQCHPQCKFLNSDGECMLVKYLKDRTEEKAK